MILVISIYYCIYVKGRHFLMKDNYSCSVVEIDLNNLSIKLKPILDKCFHSLTNCAELC
jgi:hypothetical protein